MRTRCSLHPAPGAVVLLSVALAACNPSLGDLAPEARVTCTGNQDCPQGWFCQRDLGRCVKSDAAGQPPAIVAGSVTFTPEPPFAATGTLVSVSFESSADLAVAPVVELGTPVRRPFSPVGAAGRRYEFNLVVSSDVPEGAYPVLARLVGLNGAVAADQPLGNLTVDTTPPSISRIDSLTPAVAAGQVARLEVTFGEAVDGPEGRLQVGTFQATLTQVATAQREVWRFEYAATGTEPEGAVDAVIEAHDTAGNLVSRTASAAFVLDFTPPALVVPPAVDTPVVRPGQQAVVRLEASEPLDADPVVQLVGRTSGTVLPLSAAERVGQAFTFGRLVLASDPTEIYDVRVSGLSDRAGNPGTEVTSGTVGIDATAPAVTAGPTLSKPGGQYRAGESVALTFTASEDLAGPPRVRLTTSAPIPLACQPGGTPRTWSCTTPSPLTGAETPEGAVNAVVELEDLAGNVGSSSATVVLDFTGPSVVTGSTALALTPAPGALVPTVSALGEGGRARLTFTVSEPLGASPTVATTTPEALAFTLAAQAATTYTYDHVLSGSHAQGTYAVRATLTDRAGNVTQATLAGPGFPLVVDSVRPGSPDVQTASRTRYLRIPWGSTATGGRASFTVAGQAGAAEGGATVVAYDAADPAAPSTNEIGRAAAAANGSFALVLGGGDRREVYVLAVDGAANASDGDGATPGPQAVKVRDVVWTATLGGKVPQSTIENPHALVARSRWLGPLEQGGSVERAVPAESTGGIAWRRLTASGSWSATFRAAAHDPTRGRLVAFDDAPGVLEFDGVGWTRIPYTAGPVRIDSAVFDPGRAEVLVYSDPCGGGNVLWSWNGDRWKPLAQGYSYTQWGAGGVPGPGPHPWAHLAFDERRGEVLLAPGYDNGAPFVCGDTAGALDTGTYRWDGAAWSRLPGATGNGGPFGYDAVRGVSVRVGVTSGVQEWNGTAWTTITITDPEGDGAPTLTDRRARFAFDPASQRLLTSAGGFVWEYSGSSWRRLGSSTGDANELIVTDPAGQRMVALAGSGLYAWAGTSYAGDLRPLASHAAVGMAWNAAASRMELFEADGSVQRWTSGAWTLVTPTDPGGDGNPTSLDSAAADPVGGGVLGCGTTCWRWNGTSWAATSIPANAYGLVGMPGRGILGLSSLLAIYALSGVTWTQVANPIIPYNVGKPVHSPSLGGILAGHKASNPFDPDNVVSRWTGSSLAWDTSYVAATGSGRIAPLAADGGGRTFALHDAFSSWLLAGAGAPQVAPLEDVFPTDYPTDASASAWGTADQGVYAIDATGNTWRLETEGTSRPGHLFRFSWPSSGGPELRDCLGTGAACQVSRLDLFWLGVASGNRNALVTNALFQAFDGVRWLSLGTVASAGVAGQVSRTSTITDTNLIGRMASGPGRELAFSVLVDSGPLSAASLLRTDDVSLTVTYRLP